VPPEALGLALAAAFVHAGWNVLLARAEDVEAAAAAALPVGVLAFCPLAAALWRVEAAAVPFLLGSAALELAYIALLAAAYRRAELSFVYPLTRGLAPVLVLVIGVALLGFTTTGGEVAGVVLVGSGIVVVRGVRVAPADGVALMLVAAIACCIAGYTLLDRYGVGHANPIPYLVLVLAGPAVVYPLVLGRRRVQAALGAETVAVGVGMLGAYGLVLAALQLASAASVAAVRESSIVIAVALAALVLREPVGVRRLAGAAVVALGVVLIALA
jgi:drug/metabolite transporter (DMT)-like permease